jgi:hypothetical protein
MAQCGFNPLSPSELAEASYYIVVIAGDNDLIEYGIVAA